MKTFFLLLLTTALSLTAAANDTLVVINAETQEPLRDVNVYIDHKQSIGTNIEGKFLLFHRNFKELRLAHPNFLSRILYPEDIKNDTIIMLPNERIMLSEVVVYGEKKKPLSINVMTKTDAQLLAAYKRGGYDFLRAAQKLYYKFFPSKDREKRQKKYLETLEKFDLKSAPLK